MLCKICFASIVNVLLTYGLDYCRYFPESFPYAVMCVNEGCVPESLRPLLLLTSNLLDQNPVDYTSVSLLFNVA